MIPTVARRCHISSTSYKRINNERQRSRRGRSHTIQGLHALATPSRRWSNGSNQPRRQHGVRDGKSDTSKILAVLYDVGFTIPTVTPRRACRCVPASEIDQSGDGCLVTIGGESWQDTLWQEPGGQSLIWCSKYSESLVRATVRNYCRERPLGALSRARGRPFTSRKTFPR